MSDKYKKITYQTGFAQTRKRLLSLLISGVITYFVVKFFFFNVNSAEGNGLFGLGLIVAYYLIKNLVNTLYLILKIKPSLTLSPDGILYVHGSDKLNYDWKDVGPFEAIHTKTQKYIYAYFDNTHDALCRCGLDPTPRLENAEIIFDISEITDIPNNIRAQIATNELNDRRIVFGAPEVPDRKYASDEHKDKKEVERLKQKLREQSKKNWFKLFFAFIWRVIKVILTFIFMLFVMVYGAELHLLFQRLMF